MKRFAFLTGCLVCAMVAMSQTKNEAYVQYIAKYKAIAEEQERLHKIPACITLAQGLLESGAGSSELATKAKNHFGIKCHSEWTGATYSHDDETKNECFRKYTKVADSYEDHSKFLLRPRYASLFELPITDYKGWAHGLRRCGYATDPTYAAKLIKIIEEYELAPVADAEQAPENQEPAKAATDSVVQQADSVVTPIMVAQATPDKKAKSAKSEKPAKKEKKTAVEPKQQAQSQAAQQKKEKAKRSEEEKAKKAAVAAAAAAANADEDDESQAEDIVAKALTKEKKVNATMGQVSLFSQHTVHSAKLVRWVIAEKGDTYETIGYEFNIEPARILKYNNASRGDKPETGQKVYLTRHK
ncbi:MAG: glucosaminidase domain-containing protein [Paludibacteraceae bacterium]|nr:glucosaminidase domain-containing protein [Paludibacteraceae bacterium]